MKEVTVRPEARGFAPYAPGLTIEEIKEAYGLDRVVKLASNENPLGVSPLARKAVERSADRLFRYPHNGNPRLVAALAKHLDAPEDMVVAGNGSDEIIDLLIRVKARPGLDNVVCYDHAFSVYGMVSRLCGVEYRQAPREGDFRLPLETLAEMSDEHTALVFVTSPDNPTGQAAKAEELGVLAASLPKNALLVVDEAYVDFAWPPDEYTIAPMVEKLGNVAVMRTFSKAYGLAGLRLGVGLMPPSLAEALRRCRIPFTVNMAAEEAGLAALRDEAFLMSTLELVFRGRELFLKALPGLGCQVWPSQANFVMFRPPRPAGEVFEGLLRRGVIVRHLKSFGLPDHIRVNMGTDEENAIFLAALKEVLA